MMQWQLSKHLQEAYRLQLRPVVRLEALRGCDTKAKCCKLRRKQSSPELPGSHVAPRD